VASVCDNFRFADSVRLFETGHVFKKLGSPEERCLAMAVGMRSGQQRDIFLELKSAIDLLMRKLGITDIQFGSIDTKGETAITTESGGVIGHLGIVSGRMADQLGAKGIVAYAEFDLAKLIEHFQQEREYEPLPKYPAVTRDISLLIPLDVRIGDILSTVQSTDNKQLIRDVDVFDIYEPGQGEEGDKKSVAFHVVYRADDRTLTDAEVTAVENLIKSALIDRFQAEIR
jgi:phenylalanyl-tRNA synthetase beta chain